MFKPQTVLPNDLTLDFVGKYNQIAHALEGGRFCWQSGILDCTIAQQMVVRPVFAGYWLLVHHVWAIVWDQEPEPNAILPKISIGTDGPVANVLAQTVVPSLTNTAHSLVTTSKLVTLSSDCKLKVVPGNYGLFNAQFIVEASLIAH